MEHLRVNDKIRLEEIKLSMAQVIFESIDKDRDYLQEWLPFVEHTKQLDDTRAFISSVITKDNKKDQIYTILYREEFAGLIGFKDTDWVNRKTEIGYWLIKKMQGKGIITQSVQKLVRYAFQKQKINRIQIKVAENNLQSLSIPQKLGFSFEGVEREGELHKDSYLNLKVFSLLRSDLLV